MRKRNFKLMKKTLVWYHRKKGISSINLPSDIPSESYLRFNVLGCDARVYGSGVGDYDETLDSYVIPFHAHGKSLLGGEEFVGIHNALDISRTAGTVSSGFYSTTPMSDYNGTVVIGSKHVKFKKKTAYTLAIHAKYFTTSSKRFLGLRFDYSDGTYDYPIISTNSKDIKVCITSDPTKDLVAISSHAETATTIRYGVAGFGLYEGAYTDYEEAFEAYYGQKFSIALDKPLYKINYSADTLDVVAGKLTRKIKKAVIDGSLEFSETDEVGIFEITLPVPMRAGSRIVTEFSDIVPGCDAGLSAFGDGEKILFMPGANITTKEELIEFLSSYPFEIMYIKRDYEEEHLEGTSIPNFENDVIIEILSQESPSKAFLEYV